MNGPFGVECHLHVDVAWSSSALLTWRNCVINVIAIGDVWVTLRLTQGRALSALLT
jgi:hypothetical protein